MQNKSINLDIFEKKTNREKSIDLTLLEDKKGGSRKKKYKTKKEAEEAKRLYKKMYDLKKKSEISQYNKEYYKKHKK